MKQLVLIFVLIISMSLSAQFNTDNLTMPDQTERMDKYTYDNLRIYPIRANDAFRKEFDNLKKYNVLEKAIKEKKIKITEINESGTVNSLKATNVSNEPIYIMAGEVVQGGKQDRIIGQDIVLAPGESKSLDAFCVEQGRWETKRTGTNFSGYMNVSSKGVRKAAVVNKNQSGVWQNVAEVVSGNNAESETGTYSALANSEEYNKQLDQYIMKFKSAWDNDSAVVGVVAVTGNEVIGCDIFATHDLFVKSYNNLIHSYITEAMTNGEEVTISSRQVQNYLDQFLKDESSQEENLKDDGAVFKHKGRKIHVTKF